MFNALSTSPLSNARSAFATPILDPINQKYLFLESYAREFNKMCKVSDNSTSNSLITGFLRAFLEIQKVPLALFELLPDFARCYDKNLQALGTM